MPDGQLAAAIERMDELLRIIEAHPDEVLRGQVQEIVECLLDYHSQALGRLLGILRESQSTSQADIERLAHDELVASLLVLHGLHPAELETRVAEALERVRPFLKSHGGNVQLTRIADGVVHLQLEGNCHGCPSSSATMKTRVEQAILELAPDVAGIQVEGTDAPVVPTPEFVAVERLSIG